MVFDLDLETYVLSDTIVECCDAHLDVCRL